MILLAGMQSIPLEYYEAAEIDGTGPWSRFRHITLPLIMPAFNNLIVVTMIGCLKVFDIVMVTTAGGPAGASEVINSVIYRNYGLGLYGLASAETVILQALVIVFALSTYLIVRRREVQQ